MEWVWIISLIGLAWVGALLTLVLLPGMWLTLLAAIVAQFLIKPEPMNWWLVLAIGGMALAGEIAESVSSAAGAKKFGASKSGMVGALVGSIAGAIAGTIFLAFLPIIGTLLGAVVGAGAVTVLAERSVAGRTWTESSKSGAGAAVGRVVAIAIKGGLALVQASMLTLGLLL